MHSTRLSRRQFSAGMGAALLTGASLTRAQSETRIVLGQSAALTGPASQLGLQFQAGAKLAFDQVNAQGGIGRRTIELRSLDDGYEPDRCAENTRRLINEDVLALFGYVGTPTSLAAQPLFTQAKVPFFAPVTGAESLRQPFNRLAFHVRASYADEAELIVRQLTNLGLDRIGVFYQDDAYGKAGLDAVTRALATRKLAPVATGTVARNSANVTAAVAPLVAAQPVAIVQIGAYAASAAFVLAARKAGYGGKFYNVSFVGTQALADELGKDGAGVVVSQVVPNPYSAARPIAREFLDAIAKGGNQVQPNFSSMEGYLAARLFAEGLRRAGGRASREALIAGLEAIGDHSIGGFAVSLGANDHVASSFVELSMLTGDGRVRT